MSTASTEAPERAERDHLVSLLTERARCLHERSVRLADPVQFPTDLTMQQLRVVGLVARSPGITPNELGQALGVSAPTTTGLVDRLVEKGLIVRGEHESDRRVRPLHVTAAGGEVIADLETRMQRVIERLVPLLSTAELRTLLAGYEVLLAAIDRAIARPGTG